MELTLNELVQQVNDWAEAKGWNEGLVFERMLMNLHTEI